MKELEKEEFIGYSEENFPGRNQTIISACRGSGVSPDLRYWADSLVEVVLAMIGSGAGVCLMPSDVASLMTHPHAVFVPVKEKIAPIHFEAAWRRDDERVPLRQLLDYLNKPFPD